MHTSAGIKNLFTEKFFDFGPQILVNDFFPLKISQIFTITAIVGNKSSFDFFLIDWIIGNKIMFVAQRIQMFAGN